MKEAYQALAKHLDSYPQGFPATKSGAELELLAYLFTPEEALLALNLSLQYRPLTEIAIRSGVSRPICQNLVLSMTEKGLVNLRGGPDGTEARLLPFIVGIYENQVFAMDEYFAQLFEAYYQEALHEIVSVQPQFHRVIPVNVTIPSDVEILPEEDVDLILSSKRAWAVMDCVCRKQQALLGHPCEHPIRVCLAMSDTPGAFDYMPDMDAMDLQEARKVLDFAAASGLVHTVSNRLRDISYICNCCTCGCTLLRTISAARMANVVARSSYYAIVDQSQCIDCAECESVCQFGAIQAEKVVSVDREVCTGCGVCVRVCPEGAFRLERRPLKEIKWIPYSEDEWLIQRRQARNL